MIQSVTQLLHPKVARFPRARLFVSKGPDRGREVWLEGQTVLVGSDEACQLRLTDSAVSRRHMELSGGPGGYRLRDLRSTNGVLIDGVQVMEAKLRARARLLLGRTELRFEPESEEIEWPLSPCERFGAALGRSTAMRRVFALLERAAATDAPIVMEGEPGTGKELLARAVHDAGSRREGPFVVVEVGAFASALIESELFGREPGPYAPKAALRPGALEEANGGTLFIDQLDQLPPPAQGRLARALEARQLRRGSASLELNVRIITATQVDLEAEVAAGRFREDLFFRLSVVRIRVPSLRERLEDVPMLARAFEARLKYGRPIANETIEMLAHHDWPGNVRELRAVVERLCAFPDLGASALGLALVKPAERDPIAAPAQDENMKQLFELPYHEAKERVVESFERSYLTEQLRLANGVVTRAAQRARLPRQSVHRMMRRLGLNGLPSNGMADLPQDVERLEGPASPNDDGGERILGEENG